MQHRPALLNASPSVVAGRWQQQNKLMIRKTKKYQVLIVSLIICLSCSDNNKQIENNPKTEVKLNLAEIPLVIQSGQFIPNTQINKTIEIWNQYFENNTKLELDKARQNFKNFQKNNYSRNNQLTVQDKILKANRNDTLKYTFIETDNKFSTIGLYLDFNNTRDTIIQLNVNLELGRYLNKKNHNLWTIKDIHYTIKHKENIEIEVFCNLYSSFSRYLDNNSIEQFFDASLKITNIKGYEKYISFSHLFYNPYFYMADGNIEKVNLYPIAVNLETVAMSYEKIFEHIFKHKGKYKVEVDGDIEYWKD